MIRGVAFSEQYHGSLYGIDGACSPGSFYLECIEQYADRLQKTACDDKYVENSVKNRTGVTDAVERCADGISDTTRKDPEKSSDTHGSECIAQNKNNTPAHAEVTYHRQFSIPVMINGGENNGESNQPPFHTEDNPCERWKRRTNRRKQNRCVGTSDQKINGAMVDDLHYFFAHTGTKAMVNA